MVTYNNSCLKCIHFGGWKKCLAFPDGIPEEIWTGKEKHIKPYPNDGGIVFKSKNLYNKPIKKTGD
jgi:hypothetical protein